MLCVRTPLLKLLHQVEDEEETFISSIPSHEVDGFKYVLGYITRKYRSKYSYLKADEPDEEDEGD